MATMEEQKDQQRALWSASAPGWDKHFNWLEKAIGALSKRLLDAAHVGQGTNVLDLACGSGATALAAAQRGANVVATDLTAPMVESTRRRAASVGVNVEARVMDMERMDLPDASFDAVICRFGLMFCPHPESAASEIHRVLKPGGHFALAVWDQPAHNPFFTEMGQLVQKFTNAPPPDPKAPGVFRLGPPGELERVLRAGGFTDVTTESLPITFAWPSPELYWEQQTELAAPLKGAVAKLSPDQVAKLRAAVIDMAKSHIVDGEVRLGAQPLIAFGRR
jgi:SAM-dependent methyltransferase